MSEISISIVFVMLSLYFLYIKLFCMTDKDEISKADRLKYDITSFAVVGLSVCYLFVAFALYLDMNSDNLFTLRDFYNDRYRFLKFWGVVFIFRGIYILFNLDISRETYRKRFLLNSWELNAKKKRLILVGVVSIVCGTLLFFAKYL